MAYLIPLLSAYVVYLYTYRKATKVKLKIHTLEKKINNMDKDDLIMQFMTDFKKDFVEFRVEVNSELKGLRKEVTTLKTKASMIGGLSGLVSALIVVIIKFYFFI